MTTETVKPNKTPTYRTWESMKRRCSNPKSNRYHLYGAKGITVCDRWQKFADFLADMGERPAGHTLDRINHDVGYCPENCRWATNKVQQNNRRNNLMVEYMGERMTATQCYERFASHLPEYTFYRRVKKGLPMDVAITAKPGARRIGS